MWLTPGSWEAAPVFKSRLASGPVKCGKDVCASFLQDRSPPGFPPLLRGALGPNKVRSHFTGPRLTLPQLGANHCGSLFEEPGLCVTCGLGASHVGFP